MGHYAHIVLLRETDSYALFQTDGELNTARVRAGQQEQELITRLTMFKRKQTTPERLVGRELLRHYGLISPDAYDDKAKVTADKAGRPICDYNVRFCMQCPDCITYGFAIGDSGAEKSKVFSDTAYSLTAYEQSHEAFTLNAPYESGSMSRAGVVTSRINEQDHVRPQTLFPAIVTIRDATSALFFYVLNNLLRTRRYGAQTTRTGTMSNHLVAIVLADGEISSNLRITQALFDALKRQDAIAPAQPVDPQAALSELGTLLPNLLAEQNGPVVEQLLQGAELSTFLAQLPLNKSDEGLRELLASAMRDSKAYYSAYLEKKGKK
ncbi:MAG: type I-D CRISPR-associated protein Cas7/Csc2 [Candidatus Viridilinea halotolerans]|uniref:Type I-D CRISPR-associated protein Cas7/Csc2 n=1 Tax=Candidatus Viridilinea halotolerans TaxID=2491704 RepID=A0A426TU35_9CHLR|nr:MAG: type I-D CRISPR-associated protein Cas7/Csc2 [Candidatus Viridilinea halotolerans]